MNRRIRLVALYGLMAFLINIQVYAASIDLAVEEDSNQQDVRALFETHYNAYKDFMGSTKAMMLSDTKGAHIPPYKEIIKLGAPALPYIMEKLEEDDNLWYAVRVITQMQSSPSERAKFNGDMAKLYLKWWKEDRGKEPEMLESLYSLWKQSMKQGNKSEEKRTYAKINNMGISVLPFIMEKIADGDAEFVRMVSFMTEHEIKTDATPEECLTWWGKNKDQWTLPPFEMQEEDEVLWITVPDIMKDISFSFDRCYIVPEKENASKKIVNVIEIIGKVGDRRSGIRLGIFENEADAKAGCKAHFSSCAAVAIPIIVGMGDSAERITIGDESWKFGSAIMFRKGRMLCQVNLGTEAPIDDRLNLARAMADAIYFHSAPHVIATTKDELPTIEDDSLPLPTIQEAKVRKAATFREMKPSQQTWHMDLQISGGKDADLFCFEFQQGCLIYGRTIVETRGEVRVWGDSAKAQYLSRHGKIMMRPAVGVGEMFRWGEKGVFTIGQK